VRLYIPLVAVAFMACSVFGTAEDSPRPTPSPVDAGGSEAAADGGAPDGAGGTDGGAGTAVVGCAVDAGPCTGGSFCCIHGRGSDLIECLAPKGPCVDPFSARAYCDDTTDCPTGNVCCLHFVSVWGDLASCVAGTACPADDSHNVMCDPSNPGECGAGSCVALSDARPTYFWRLPAFVCRP
jgi:hypothetical protein